MRRLLLFAFARSLRLFDGQAPLAKALCTPFSAPVPPKGRRGVGISFNHRATRGRLA